MDEEWIASADVGIRAEGHGRAGEGAPRICGDGVGGRTDGEEVHHHQFAVVVPTGGDEAGFGTPAHGEGLAAVEHPGPVDAIVELSGERSNLGIVEIRADGEDAAEEDGGVDRGDFDVDERPAGFDVAEVVEEAVLVRHFVEMEVERGDDLFFDAGAVLIAALVGNAEGSETEAGSGDASGEMLVKLAGGGLVGGTV